MRRRDFFGFAGGAIICRSTEVLAQKAYRVAVLIPSQSQWQPRTFQDALQDLGYRVGANLIIEVLSAENELDRLPNLASNSVATGPDVIVAVNTPGTRAAMSATTSIPIVSAIVADPVFLGIVSNIASRMATSRVSQISLGTSLRNE
jgi:putative ABC transport system substrate-binding protein